MRELCVCRDIEHLGSLESTQEAVPHASATLTPLSCSPNFTRAQYLDIRTLTHELIVNYWSWGWDKLIQIHLDWKINCFDLKLGARRHYGRLGLCGVFLKVFVSGGGSSIAMQFLHQRPLRWLFTHLHQRELTLLRRQCVICLSYLELFLCADREDMRWFPQPLQLFWISVNLKMALMHSEAFGWQRFF